MNTFERATKMNRLKTLLIRTRRAHDFLNEVTSELDAVICDPDIWQMLDQGSEVFEHHEWRLARSAGALGRLHRISEFLENPSRPKLKRVLEVYDPAGTEIEAQLALFDLQNAARQACLPQPVEAEVVAMIARNRERLAVAMMSECDGKGVTSISKITGKSRSTVYAAIAFYRELPEAMRLAIVKKMPRISPLEQQPSGVHPGGGQLGGSSPEAMEVTRARVSALIPSA